MPTNGIIDVILIVVAIGSALLLMRYYLQKKQGENTTTVWVLGAVMVMAVALLFWPKFAS
jgi:uncharacterized membrane-anchored protein